MREKVTVGKQDNNAPSVPKIPTAIPMNISAGKNQKAADAGGPLKQKTSKERLQSTKEIIELKQKIPEIQESIVK